jgi:hypothetical protein
MTQEDKKLLLADLSARLPHHVRVKVWLKDGTTEEGILDLKHNYGDVLRDAFYYNKIVDIKPYLRPLSSMTKEERYEIQEILGKDIEILDGFINIIESSRKRFSFLELHALFNWLNVHYFDYSGLIEKELALEALEGMYNIK